MKEESNRAVYILSAATYNIKDTALACLRKVELCEQEETSLVPEIYGSALFYIVPLIVMSVSYSSLIRILVKR